MKKIIVFLTVLLLTISLSGCEEKDEYGKKYDIGNTDIILALEKDLSLESVIVKYISYGEEVNDNYSIEYMIDGNKGYSKDHNIYYEQLVEYSLCTIQYDLEIGDGFVRHGIMISDYMFLKSASSYVMHRLQSSSFDEEDYEIEGGFYKYATPFVINGEIYIYIRVNSQNFIDYFKIVSIKDGKETIREEHFLSSHNETSIDLPESEYMSPLDYEISIAEKEFTMTSRTDSQINFSNDEYSANIDIINQTILFSKGSRTTLYQEVKDIAAVRTLIGDSDWSSLFMVLLTNDRMEKGRYNNCLED